MLNSQACCGFKSHQGAINCIAVSKEECKIFSGGDDGKVKYWNTSGDLKNTFFFSSSVTSLFLLEEESHLLIGEESGRISVVNIDT
jgi:WD40 repeat protein